ncbi:o-succinylbenzoate synthase [Alicyclobacillus dauci]|uniref:o-succinylbenzoate synthase n=2 Tax=Alicyclobacillus dauci TaxID=1475485 RepID=A0ABY6Z1P4_9BACL|nr:o-succinylbenzoate synthase [Alicyclobacillus dauci]
MRVRKCTLRRVQMPLREPVKTSYGMHAMKDVTIVIVETEKGAVGVAECVAMREPTYTEETVSTAWHVLTDFLVPSMRDVDINETRGLRYMSERWGRIRGNWMAKAGLEMAIWDAYAAETKVPLYQLLGGTVREVPAGISLGMNSDLDALQERARRAVADGFQRIKLKIAPGADVEPLMAIRRALPDIPLMADANSAYEGCAQLLAGLDGVGLMMIEQPLAYDDIVDHAALQDKLRTPICLDESIRSANDVRRAAMIGACKVINLKPGRVGGFGSSIAVHDEAVRLGLGLWCGGMYETGIGRLHNIALCSLPGFGLPTDTGPSDRYFESDIVDPPVTFHRPGFLAVEPLCGVASRVNWKRLDDFTVQSNTIVL